MVIPSSTSEPLPAARLLAMSGAWLIVIGLATGGLVSSAMTGQIAADVHSSLASHLNGLLGGLWMIAVAWTLPMLSYGARGQNRLAWGLIVANWANWLVTAVKAFLGVAGVGLTRDPANNGVFIALMILVVIPGLASSVGWAWGFRRP